MLHNTGDRYVALFTSH